MLRHNPEVRTRGAAADSLTDVTQTLALVDGIPPVGGKTGRSRRRPDAVLGDKGYDGHPDRRER
ncbi:hypothetical protein [Streptomyces sp. NPDC054834]